VMASRLLVMRLNSVDLPTFGRPTMAMTGFMACAASGFFVVVEEQERSIRFSERAAPAPHPMG